MSNSLSVTTLPAASLRERSIEVELATIGTPKFQSFLDELIETMFVENGVGIAASQVGRNIRVFIINDRGRGIVYINPIVELVGGLTKKSEEGCLSVPNITGIVKRAKKVKVSALDRHARRIACTAKGFSAIVFQHEMDHLEGILFVDKVERYTQGSDNLRV